MQLTQFETHDEQLFQPRLYLPAPQSVRFTHYPV